DHLLVGGHRPPDHALERAGQRVVRDLVLRLDHAAVFAPASGLTDHALVPAKLKPAGVERIDLAARLEDDADDCGHTRYLCATGPGRGGGTSPPSRARDGCSA